MRAIFFFNFLSLAAFYVSAAPQSVPLPITPPPLPDTGIPLQGAGLPLPGADPPLPGADSPLPGTGLPGSTCPARSPLEVQTCFPNTRALVLQVLCWVMRIAESAGRNCQMPNTCAVYLVECPHGVPTAKPANDSISKHRDNIIKSYRECFNPYHHHHHHDRHHKRKSRGLLEELFHKSSENTELTDIPESVKNVAESVIPHSDKSDQDNRDQSNKNKDSSETNLKSKDHHDQDDNDDDHHHDNDDDHHLDHKHNVQTVDNMGNILILLDSVAQILNETQIAVAELTTGISAPGSLLCPVLGLVDAIILLVAPDLKGSLCRQDHNYYRGGGGSVGAMPKVDMSNVGKGNCMCDSSQNPVKSLLDNVKKLPGVDVVNHIVPGVEKALDIVPSLCPEQEESNPPGIGDLLNGAKLPNLLEGVTKLLGNKK